MADFRDISQQYAQGGIKAAILVNGGAAVALLSQAAALLKQGLADEIACALLAWAAGVTIGALCWISAFVSTRYVDKSERNPEKERWYLLVSDMWMYLTMSGFLASIGCFAIGCRLLARSLSP